MIRRTALAALTILLAASVDCTRHATPTRETFKGRTAHALDAARVQALKDFVETARAELRVPGVAVSLFTTDSVIFEGGFGVRELGKDAPVTADTLFMIASNSKPLSTLLLATLVGEGKLTWDTQVTSLYPAFKLGDAGLTSRVTMKQLLCMCTGFPREEDAEWLLEFKGSSPKSFIDRLGAVKSTRGFGEAFQYTDLLPAAAAFIGAAVVHPERELGAAYDEAMKTRVFVPLGMTSTTFDFAEALSKDHASPHAEDFSGQQALAAIDVDRALASPVRPAAGAWSNVKDMRRYVQMELAKGKLPDHSRFISEEALLARRAPQIAHSARVDETYGLGLGVNTELGITYVHHGGDVVGYKTDFFFLPEHGVGGVVLTNAESGWNLCRGFLRRTLEVLFDGNPRAAEDLRLAAGKRRDWVAKQRAGFVLPADPAVTAKLAERYTDATLGEIVVHTDTKGTVFDFGQWKSTVASRKNDDGTTTLLPIDPGVGRIDFVVANQGTKRSLVLRDPQHEHVFEEVGPREGR